MIEGNSVSPITCSAECYPECHIIWKINKTGHLETITSNGTLFFKNVSKEVIGIYHCTVTHPKNESRFSSKSVLLNVQCK